MPRCLLFVRFSNRPSGSSTFRLTTTPVSMSLTGSRFSSDSAPRPFHHGDSKTRWNNLSGGLAVNMTAGPSGQTNARIIHNADARFLDRNIKSSKIVHAALLLLMLEAAYADLVSPSA